MPFAIQIDPRHRVGLIVFRGTVDGVLALDAAQALIDDAAWQSGFDEVWDLTAATSLAVSPA
ncbi:MAG: hypothetical protein AAGG50_18180 [Bacteroidota bacterium]